MSAGPHLSEECIASVIEKMGGGLTLKDACGEAGIDYPNVVRRISDSENLKQLHTRAREDYAHFKVQQMHTIASDEGIDVKRARLMCDNIKWEAARVLPKVYGDKLEVGGPGPGGAFVIDISTKQQEPA